MDKIQKLLENISDPKQKILLENIAYGKIIKQIKCMSKECKGRIVAYIYNNGDIRGATNEIGEMHLRAIRHRLDGYLGFECWCGNDSRLCKEEKGVAGIENNTIQASDIELVAERIFKTNPQYPIRDKKQLIDNFLIEEL